MRSFKVAIIGGGPGGYVTAIRLKQYGIDSIVFEKERLGGVCLNHGCIPTKSMVKVAELYSEIKNADSFGLNIENHEINLPKIIDRKDEIVNKLVSGIEFVFKKREIPIINDNVHSIKKTDKGYIVESETESVSADYLIIATGSQPKELPFMKFDGNKILSSKDILKMKELPESLAIVGGGVIGCEFATIFNQLGSKVDIIEFLPNLISTEDSEITKRLTMALKKSKIKVHLKKAVEGYEIIDNKVSLNITGNKTVVADKVLVSVGRAPRFDIKTDGFDLDFKDTALNIDDHFRTNEHKVFAIGDVTAKMMLAHTASKQGLIVADIIKQELNHQPIETHKLIYENIPRCTFTHPEVASVGLTEEQAKEKYGEISVGKAPFSANGKSLGLGNQFGFTKTISDKATGKVVGMHIIGPQATELIAQGGIITGLELTSVDIDKVIFAHPTLSEVVMESIEDTEGIAIHTV